ncbi:MAG: hypothetical protein ACJASV_000387 [Pseudorhodobacter sp.]
MPKTETTGWGLDRRRLMVRADLVRLLLTLIVVALVLSQASLPLPAEAGTTAIIALSLLAFLLGSAEVLRDNAAQTILPTVVDKADLETANGQMWSAEQVMGRELALRLPFAFAATVIFCVLNYALIRLRTD